MTFSVGLFLYYIHNQPVTHCRRANDNGEKIGDVVAMVRIFVAPANAFYCHSPCYPLDDMEGTLRLVV